MLNPFIHSRSLFDRHMAELAALPDEISIYCPPLSIRNDWAALRAHMATLDEDTQIGRALSVYSFSISHAQGMVF